MRWTTAAKWKPGKRPRLRDKASVDLPETMGVQVCIEEKPLDLLDMKLVDGSRVVDLHIAKAAVLPDAKAADLLDHKAV